MPADLISVIIPVYQVEQYLETCVKSVINQTYTNLEIILIDDGSTDQGPAICDKLAKQDSRIVVVHKENEGAAEARNVGIRLAKGKYITFVDSDDTIHPNMIELLYRALKECNTKVSACGLTRCNRQELNYSNIKKLVFEINDSVEHLYKTRDVFPVAKLYDARLFAKRMFVKGMLYEDIFLIPRLLMDIKTLAVVKEKRMYYYYQRADSSMVKTKQVIGKDYSRNMDFIVEYVKRKYASEHEKFKKILTMAVRTTCSRLAKLENTDYSQSKDYISILRRMIARNMKNILINKYMDVWEKQMCCYLLFSTKGAVNVWKNHKIYGK